MVNLTFYEQGLEDGIEQGQLLLLIELLKKKLGNISETYIYKLESLESNIVFLIASNIFEIKKIDDLDKYFT